MGSATCPPPILFKYCGPSGYRILESGEIAFPPAIRFNDPHDGHVKIEAAFEDGFADEAFERVVDNPASRRDLFERAKSSAIESLPRRLRRGKKGLRKKMERALSYEHPNVQHGLAESMVRLRIAAHELAALLPNRISESLVTSLGILCLSESEKTMTMWAHYAHNREGFVIGFDTADSFFQVPISRLTGLHKIEYAASGEIPHIEVLASEIGWPRLPEIFFTKGRDWEHEKEWRLVVEMEDPSNPPEIRKLSTSCIASVILGDRMSSVDKRILVELIADKWPNVNMFDAVPSSDSYAMELLPFQHGIH